jgi:hypothetical protein
MNKKKKKKIERSKKIDEQIFCSVFCEISSANQRRSFIAITSEINESGKKREKRETKRERKEAAQ